MLILKLLPKNLTYIKFLIYINDGIDMIEKSIKNGIRIYQKRPRTDKNKSIIINSNKIIKAIELFKSMIDNDEFKYYAKSNNNTDLDWMIDKYGYEETTEEAVQII